MAIGMQGGWTISVRSRHAAYAQRIVVSGALQGDGVYDGIVDKAVYVNGPQWTLQVQHRPAQRAWSDSAQRIGLPRVEDGVLCFELCSNDGGLDLDFDDLILSCSTPVSRADHVIYGNVSTYAGGGPFNPRRDDHIVIDEPADLAAVCARHPGLGEVLAKLYPERLRALRGTGSDPTPLVIPSGLPQVSVGLVFEPPGLRDASVHACDERDMARARQTRVRRVPFKVTPPKGGLDALSEADLAVIAELREVALRQRCGVEPAREVSLRFQHYTPSSAERSGGAYAGNGLREELGAATTDEQGNYLFRFPRERAGDMRPDIIVQAFRATGGVPHLAFESAPYHQVANLRRIDLCVPYARLRPGEPCVDDRVIQRAEHVPVESSGDPLGVRMRRLA